VPRWQNFVCHCCHISWTKCSSNLHFWRGEQYSSCLCVMLDYGKKNTAHPTTRIHLQDMSNVESKLRLSSTPLCFITVHFNKPTTIKRHEYFFNCLILQERKCWITYVEMVWMNQILYTLYFYWINHSDYMMFFQWESPCDLVPLWYYHIPSDNLSSYHKVFSFLNCWRM